MQLLLWRYLSGSGLTDRIHGSCSSQKFGNTKPRLRGQSCLRTRDKSWNVIRHSFTFAPTRFSWCWIRCKRKLMLESQIRSSRVRKLSRFSCDYNPIWMLCQQWDNVPIRIQFKLKSRKQLLELISKRDETKGAGNDTRSSPIPNRFIAWSIDMNVENDCQIVRIHLRR